MREAFIIGAFYAALGAIVAALAVKYAEPSLLWDIVLWGGVTLAIGCIASLWLSASHQATGRSFLFPAALINLGLCLIVFGWFWHFYNKRPDNEFMWFRVDISDPANLTAPLPLRIKNQRSGPFANVDVWFSPWSSKPGSQEYFSIGPPLKVSFPVLQHGDYPYGRAIQAGDYRIEFDGTLHDLTYHFVEHLKISERDKALIQSIEVRRTIGGKDEAVVFSSYDWRP